MERVSRRGLLVAAGGASGVGVGGVGVGVGAATPPTDENLRTGRGGLGATGAGGCARGVERTWPSKTKCKTSQKTLKKFRETSKNIPFNKFTKSNDNGGQ